MVVEGGEEEAVFLKITDLIINEIIIKDGMMIINKQVSELEAIGLVQEAIDTETRPLLLFLLPLILILSAKLKSLKQK